MTDATILLETEKELGSALATRIRALRGEQALSLDGLARSTGLSKGTVVALEQGKANPSIGVLCRLAAAFSLSVSDLLSDPSEAEPHAPIERMTPKMLWTSPEGSHACLHASLHASTSGRTMFELWSWILMPGNVFHADAHSPDTRELISVAKGNLRVAVGNETVTLKAGDAARLVTDQPHSYAPANGRPVQFSMAVLERGGQPLSLSEADLTRPTRLQGV